MSMTDAQTHGGHRSRMRDKYIRCGADVFDSHELLELLLYYVIPYKDTNPIAHRLLTKFETLDGVFSAEEAALCEVSGIGASAARFLRLFGQSGRDGLFLCEEGESLCDYERVGLYLRSVYARTEGKAPVYLLMLDNRMRFLAIESMGEEAFSVVARKAQPFVKRALLSSAAVVIVAHTHTYGSLFLTPEERATDAALKEDLARAGIAYAEHYLFCGNSYVGCLSHEDMYFRQYEALENFKRSRVSAHPMAADDAPVSQGPLFEDAKAYLCRALSPICSEKVLTEATEALLARFGLVRRVLEADITALMHTAPLTPAMAIYIKLLASITARRVTDTFSFGRIQSKESIRRYFVYRMYGADIERVYMMMLDENDAVIACPCVSEGAVNSSGITPRRFLEIAVRAGAQSVILAHNHPSGHATASEDDYRATEMLQAAFRAAGIRLIDHMVVAGNNCISMADVSADRFGERYSFRFS